MHLLQTLVADLHPPVACTYYDYYWWRFYFTASKLKKTATEKCCYAKRLLSKWAIHELPLLTVEADVMLKAGASIRSIYDTLKAYLHFLEMPLFYWNPLNT